MKLKAIKIIDKCEREIGEIENLLYDFIPFARERLKFKSYPPIILKSDSENANVALGRTAHYDPQKYSITVFVDGRHIKDILRSIAHELVHHKQIRILTKLPTICDGVRPGRAKTG